MPDTTIGLATSFITFSRPGASGGGATTTDRDGKIKWAGHNLLTNSESFDASSWPKTNITAAANALSAPNGTTTADTVTTSDVNSLMYQSVTVIPGATYTFAFWAKRGTMTDAKLSVYDTNGSNIIAPTSYYSSTSASDWSLITQAFTAPAFCTQVYVYPLRSSNVTGTIHLWGAHLYRSDLGGMQLNPAMPAGMQSYYPTTPRNLLGYTEDVNSWTKDGATVNTNAVIAPNGLQTADAVLETATTGEHSVYQSITASSGQQTLSFYAKAGLRSRCHIRLNLSSAWRNANFLLSGSGSVGTTTGFVRATITALADGWYRCEASFSNRTNALVVIGVSTADEVISYAGDSSAPAIYLWGAQLSDSASLDTYVPQYGAAVTSAAYYAPRLDFDGATLAAKGLLVEELRTNLLLQSNGFDTASWTKTRSSAAFVSGTAPDGSTTIAKITEDSTASESHLVQISATVVNGTTYTWTVYAKAGERTWLCLYNSNVTQGKFFNLSTGALGSNFVGAPAASSITPVGNGWYRCSISFAATGTSATLIHYLATADNTAVYNGDGTSGLYLYGAQLEAGSFATSYIPNGSAVAGATRAADVASVSTQAFPYSASEGTLVVETQFRGNGGVQAEFGPASPRTVIGSSTLAVAAIQRGGGVVTSSQGVVGIDKVTKSALTLNSGDGQLYVNGVSVGNSSGTTATAYTTLQLGTNPANGEPLNGYIRRVTYIPRRLSNAELASRTAA